MLPKPNNTQDVNLGPELCTPSTLTTISASLLPSADYTTFNVGSLLCCSDYTNCHLVIMSLEIVVVFTLRD